MRIGFIGFGEAARAFTDSLTAAGATVTLAYDILFEQEGLDGPTARAAQDRGVGPAPTPAAVADASDWIFSAVTASSSFDAAAAVARDLAARHVFFDINSVSPDRKRQSGRRIAENGARYVDMAVMAPVIPRGHRTPVLVAGGGREGGDSEDVDAALRELGFVFERVGPNAGEATAVKMVRSLFVKGLEAITVEVLLAARRSNCFDRVVGSLRETFPGLEWDRFPAYELERVARHGIRRAAEMRESAATLRELGFDGELAQAVAQTQERIGALGLRLNGSDLVADVDRILARGAEVGDRPRGE